MKKCFWRVKMKKTLLTSFFLFLSIVFLFSSGTLNMGNKCSHIENLYDISKNVELKMLSIERIIPQEKFRGSFLNLLNLSPSCMDFQIQKNENKGGYVNFLMRDLSSNSNTYLIRIFNGKDDNPSKVQFLFNGKNTLRDILDSDCVNVSIDEEDNHLGIILDFNECEEVAGRVFLDIYFHEENGNFVLDDISLSYDRDFSPDEFVNFISENCETNYTYKLSEPYGGDDRTYYRNLIVDFSDNEEYPIEGNVVYVFQFEESGDRTYVKLVDYENNLLYYDPTDFLVSFLEDNFCADVKVSKEDMGNNKYHVEVDAELHSNGCENNNYNLNGVLKISYYLVERDGNLYFDSLDDIEYEEEEEKYLYVGYNGNVWEIDFYEIFNFNEIEEVAGNYKLVGSLTISKDDELTYDIYLEDLENSEIIFHFFSENDEKLKFISKKSFPYAGKSFFELPEIEVFSSDNLKQFVKPGFTFNFTYGNFDEAEVKVVIYLRTVVGDNEIKNKIEKSFSIQIPEGGKYPIDFLNIFQFIGYMNF